MQHQGVAHALPISIGREKEGKEEGRVEDGIRNAKVRPLLDAGILWVHDTFPVEPAHTCSKVTAWLYHVYIICIIIILFSILSF